MKSIQFDGQNRREVLAFAMPYLSEDALAGVEVMKLPIVVEAIDRYCTLQVGDWVHKTEVGLIVNRDPKLTKEEFKRLLGLS